MFLDETLNTSLDFDTLMSESYENLIEYQNEMHELDMKMIKCEHTCIVNEDSNMQMLAEEEYNSKLAATFRAIWNKIVIKIQEFIIFISKQINKFRIRFKIKNNNIPTANMINDALKKSKKVDTKNHLNNNIEINSKIIEDPENFATLLKNTISKLEGLLKNEDSTSLKQAYDDIKDNIGLRNSKFTSGRVHKLDDKIITNAYKIIHDKSYVDGWMKLLNEAKAIAKKQSSMMNVVKNSESTANATWFQRLINLIILDIQTAIKGCVKICYTVDSIIYKNDNANKGVDGTVASGTLVGGKSATSSNDNKTLSVDEITNAIESAKTSSEVIEKLKENKDAIEKLRSEKKIDRDFFEKINTVFRKCIKAELEEFKKNIAKKYDDIFDKAPGSKRVIIVSKVKNDIESARKSFNKKIAAFDNIADHYECGRLATELRTDLTNFLVTKKVFPKSTKIAD